MSIKSASILKNRNAIISTVVFCLLFILYEIYFNRTQFLSSDNAGSFLLLLDWLGGNYRLDDWIISTNNFLFTDAVWCVPGILLGMDLVTIIGILACLFHAGYIAMILYVMLEYGTRKNLFKRESHLVLATMLCLMLMATFPYMAQFQDSPTFIFLNTDIHTGTFFLIAIEIILLSKWIKAEYKGMALPIAYAIIGALIIMSDNYALMVFFGPVFAFSIYYIIWPKVEHNYKGNAIIAISSVASVVLGNILIKCTELYTGATNFGVSMHISNLHEILHNGKFFLFKLLTLFGFDYQNGDRRWAWLALVLLILGSIALSVIYQIICAVKSKPNSLEWMLTIAIVANIVGTIFIDTDTEVGARYLLTIPFFGPVLVILTVFSINKPVFKKSCVVAIACFSLAFGITNIIDIRKADNVGDNVREVVNYIEDRGWGNGYGGYWSSINIAMYSNFETMIYPTFWFDWGVGFYKPMFYYQPEWYEEDDLHYIVLFSNDDFFLADKARKADWLLFAGDPQEDVVIGRYEILYYEQDLHQYLTELPA
ncbi:MAG: hypothetical protein MJ094_04315 [Saccharofermentans sp.]|nr:hypothetical protein [Saccharofermentans sp.]